MMNRRGRARQAAIAGLLLIGTLGAGCGSPDVNVALDYGTDQEATEELRSGVDQQANPVTSGSGPEEAEKLRLALASIGKFRAFRVTSATGQTLRIPALGIDQVQPLDPVRPTVVAETAADGSSHSVVDFGPLLVPLSAQDPEASAAVDQATLEIWVTSTSLIIDSTGYQAVADLNPAAELGPFAPGIGAIDLTRLGDVGGDDLVVAVTGVDPVDPVELAARLPVVIDGIARDPADPSVFSARVSYADLIEAQGADPELTARSIAAGVAPSMGLSVDELAAFYVRYYDSTPSDLTIILGADGALRSIQSTTDLSDVYQALFSADSGLDLGASDAELAEARELFADVEWILELVTAFELDDSIAVTPPPGPHEDRTDLALRYFAELVPG